MNRERFVLSDTVWQKIEALLPGKKTDRGVTARDNRLFLEAVLWRVRAGLPWRDLPAEFGHWNSVFTRFRRWARAKVFDRIFKDAALDRGDVSAKLRADLAAQECTVHTPPILRPSKECSTPPRGTRRSMRNAMPSRTRSPASRM